MVELSTLLVREMKTRDQNIWEESDLKNFQDLMLALDACYWLHKTISLSLSRFEDDRRWDVNRFLLLRRFNVLFGAVFICIFLSQSESDL